MSVGHDAASPASVDAAASLPHLRIAFAGTPGFAATALSYLLVQGFDVALVFTQPDRPAGRGQQLQSSPVKRLALQHGLPVIQPQGLRLDGRFADDAQSARAALHTAGVQAMVIVAYGLILPPWMLEAPALGCFNIHGSLLPRWRGAAPIQRAVEAGDVQTGITIIQMDAGLDTGDMLACEAVPIHAGDTAATVHDRLAPLGARLVGEVLDLAARGALAPRVQPAEGTTYAAKIDKREAAIDWQQAATVIERRLRAFDPVPGCTFMLDGQVTKLWRGREVDAAMSFAEAGGLSGGTPLQPGQTLVDGDRLGVVCGTGCLQVLELQRPGARRIDAAAYLRSRTPRPPTSA